MKDGTVLQATGRRKEDWFGRIEEEVSPPFEHKSVVAYLRGQGVSHWWAQELTVLFEQEKGLRVPGQTSDGLFQVGVNRTLALSPEDLWNHLVSPAGWGAVMGEPMESGPAPGDGGVTPGGTQFRITTFRQGSHFRLSFRLPDWEAPSILQIRVNHHKGEEKSVLSFHQEKIPGEALRSEMKERWIRAADYFNSIGEVDGR